MNKNETEQFKKIILEMSISTSKNIDLLNVFLNSLSSPQSIKLNHVYHNSHYCPLNFIFCCNCPSYINCKDFIKILDLFIDYGYDINCKDREGETLMHDIVFNFGRYPSYQSEYLEMIIYILDKYHPNLTIKNRLEQTVFDIIDVHKSAVNVNIIKLEKILKNGGTVSEPYVKIDNLF